MLILEFEVWKLEEAAGTRDRLHTCQVLKECRAAISSITMPRTKSAVVLDSTLSSHDALIVSREDGSATQAMYG